MDTSICKVHFPLHCIVLHLSVKNENNINDDAKTIDSPYSNMTMTLSYGCRFCEIYQPNQITI